MNVVIAKSMLLHPLFTEYSLYDIWNMEFYEIWLNTKSL